MSARDAIERRLVPRAVVALSEVRLPRRVEAAVLRALGRRARVRLFVAFDDPASAVALLGLVPRLAGRRVELMVEPVVARGIPGDPAVAAKRAYAVLDARRLARRDGLELVRDAPVDAEDTAFLAAWASDLPVAARAAFSAAVMHRLWFESNGPVESADYLDLWREHGSGEPPAPVGSLPGEQGMRRRRLYDTPVAAFAGQWFFAHERLEQIAHGLDELGWSAAS